jgi:hypothetical protein
MTENAQGTERKLAGNILESRNEMFKGIGGWNIFLRLVTEVQVRDNRN